MHRFTTLLVLVGSMAATMPAAEIGAVDRFGSVRQAPGTRAVLLPGPYLLSPVGTPSLGGRTWRTVSPGKGQLSLGSNSKSRDRNPGASKPMSPRVMPPAPRPESLRFDGRLPNLDTSLPLAKPASTGL